MNTGELFKIGRNQTCICGSGKKYKKCCWGNSNPLKLTSFEITSDPMPELNADENISASDQVVYDELGQKLFNGEITDFHQAIETLSAFKQKYPDVKRIYNLLSVCYERIGEKTEVENLIFQTYKMFPEYLFAKTAYVSYWMQKNDYSKFDEVFSGCYDLKAIYPTRNKFHISEAFTFFIVCGRHFAEKGNIETAERYLEMAHKLKPNDHQLGILEKEILVTKLQEFAKSIPSNKKSLLSKALTV